MTQAYHSARAGAASGGATLTQKAAAARRDLADRADPAPDAAVSRVDELERLAALRRSGVLDEDEFRREKARILGTPTTRAAV